MNLTGNERFILDSHGSPITRTVDDLGFFFETTGYVLIPQNFAENVGIGIEEADTDAFKAIRDALENTRIDVFGGSSVADASVFVPPGDYYIGEAEALMSASHTNVNSGLQFIGAGPIASRIIYDPGTSGPLFSNNDAWNLMRFRDIRFHCLDESSDFMLSESTGGPQDIAFASCAWTGTWRDVLHLTGTDVNSEISFVDSQLYGGCRRFLWAEESDQNLNYWFQRFKFWPLDKAGTLVRMQKGGHVSLRDVDVSAFGSDTPADPVYLIELLGGNHSRGVCFFLADGLRVEHHHDNARLINCEWGQGAVTFRDYDGSSQQPFHTYTTQAIFDLGDNRGPNILFDQCKLIGTHEYHYASARWPFDSCINYRGVTGLDREMPEDLISYSETASHTNYGGKPLVHFEDNCKSNVTKTDSFNRMWGCVLGADQASHSIGTKPHIWRPRSSAGLMLSGGASRSIQVPLGSRVRALRAILASSVAAEANAATWTLQTGEGTPTVLHSWTADPHSDGYDEDVDLDWLCDSVEKATLVFAADANVSEATVGVVEIGYTA